MGLKAPPARLKASVRSAVPVNALAMQGVLPHDIDGVVQESRRIRRDRSRTVLRARGGLLASQAYGRAEEEQRACEKCEFGTSWQSKASMAPALI